MTEFADSYSHSYRVGALVGGDYHLLKELGRGGMGAVFLAQHRLIDKPVALKILFPDLVNASTWQRFEREGRVLARLHHPGIVGVLNMGVDDGRCPFYVMELLEGLSLSQCLESRERLTLSESVNIFAQVAEAMHFAHEKGVIHRDLKPSNIMLIDRSEIKSRRTRGSDLSKCTIKIVDFGIAKSIENKGQAASTLLNSAENQKLQSLTQTGEIFGTPFYLSPEQCLGRPVSRQTDIYALGCSLFETLTGQPPFRGSSAFETMGMHLAAPVPAISQYVHDLPVEVQSIINLCLSKNTVSRYASMKQLALDLKRLEMGLPTAAAGLKAAGFAPPLEVDVAVSEEELEHSDREAGWSGILERKETKKKAKSILSVAGFAITATVVLLIAASLHYLKLEKTKVDMSKDNSLKQSKEVLEAVSSNANKFEKKISQGVVDEQTAKKLLAPLKDFGPVKHGDGYLFSFPADFSIGQMQDKFYPTQSRAVNAQGQVFVRLASPWLDLDEDVPVQVVGKLIPDSVDLKLTIYQDEQIKSLTKTLQGWKHLWSLQIKDRKLDSAFVSDLLALPYIENLHIHNTITTDGGSKESRKLNARTIIVEQVLQDKPGDLKAFLAILDPVAVKELIFRRTPLDLATAKGLHRFKNMETLSLEGAVVSPDLLGEVANIKSLRNLTVEDNYYNASCILQIISNNPHIKRLNLSTPQFQREEKERILAYLHDWQDPGRPWKKEEIAQIGRKVSLHFSRRRFIQIPSGSFETIEKLSRIGLGTLFK